MIQEGKRGGKRGKEKVWEIEDTKKNGKIIPKYMSHHKNVKCTKVVRENKDSDSVFKIIIHLYVICK